MKRTITAILFLFIIIFSSCGPSEEEKAKIVLEAKEELKREQAAREALQTSINMKTAQLAETRAALIEKNADLEAEKDKMTTIKEFQLLRTDEERETQIKNQAMVIGRIEETIIKLQTTIPMVENEIVELKAKLQNL